MPRKHIILIHGRGLKPPPGVLERLTRRSWVGGLERVDREAAGAVTRTDVKVTLAYFGDLTNAFMIEADPRISESMIRRRGRWFERPDTDAADLDRLLSRPTGSHTEQDYRELVREYRGRRFLDDVVRVVGPIASMTGLGVYAIGRLFPDLGAYLSSRKWGSDIRLRLQRRLRPALARGDDVALIAHSMGSIVAYDVLWKLSRLSEHRPVHHRKISLWLTLGTPLGDRSIQDCLYDSNEGEDGRYPANVVEWINAAAHDDFVAHDGTVADDFEAMLSRGLVQRIRDLPRIYTFWVGAKGVNPHKFYAYLNHPAVARPLARWIRSASAG
jgi:hypothetical protein